MSVELEDQCDTTTLIQMHYRNEGIWEGWSKSRFFRLCRMIKRTPVEVAAMCCVDRKTLSKFLRNGMFPAHVALHLRLIEAAWLESRLGMKPVNPVVPLHLFAGKE